MEKRFSAFFSENALIVENLGFHFGKFTEINQVLDFQD